jgi:hypothetical protein
MQYNPSIEIQRKDNMSQVTLRKGYWFYFDHEGNDISMHGSAWSGKETIYFNNKPVSSFRNLIRLKSEHFFNENGREYKVVTNMKSILRGTLEVALYCNDELVQTESVTYAKKGTFIKDLWKYILVGAITGGLIGYFDLINWFWG